jgi:hypothetical protein
VTGDPPAGRGQLAARLKSKEINLKIQLLNRPRKRVNPRRPRPAANEAHALRDCLVVRLSDKTRLSGPDGCF